MDPFMVTVVSCPRAVAGATAGVLGFGLEVLEAGEASSFACDGSFLIAALFSSVSIHGLLNLLSREFCFDICAVLICH